MKFADTSVEGAFLIELDRLEDERGFFARTWCQDDFQTRGLMTRPVQYNVSMNGRRGTLRGLHAQVAPHADVKLVRCTRGAVFDVAVDLRTESASYLKWYGAELSADNHRQLYIPEGCAHAYLTLTDEAEVSYFVSKPYVRSSEIGFRFDDSAFDIDWPIDVVLVSDKDLNWPAYRTLRPTIYR